MCFEAYLFTPSHSDPRYDPCEFKSSTQGVPNGFQMSPKWPPKCDRKMTEPYGRVCKIRILHLLPGPCFLLAAADHLFEPPEAHFGDQGRPKQNIKCTNKSQTCPEVQQNGQRIISKWRSHVYRPLSIFNTLASVLHTLCAFCATSGTLKIDTASKNCTESIPLPKVSRNKQPHRGRKSKKGAPYREFLGYFTNSLPHGSNKLPSGSRKICFGNVSGPHSRGAPTVRGCLRDCVGPDMDIWCSFCTARMTSVKAVEMQTIVCC